MKCLAAPRFALALGLAAGIAAPALAADKDPVVAVVNGSDIRASAVAEFQHSLPPQMQQAPFPMLLDALVNNLLIDEAAHKEGIQNDPEVKRAFKRAEETIIRKAWMQKKLHAQVTDAALQERYAQFVAAFKPEDEIRARHVLLETEDQARAVIAELKGGANFETVAKAKSKDPSAQQNGGDLGYFTRNEMVPQFSEVAFGLKVGEMTQQPVKTQFGWHVIKVEDRRKTTAPSFDDAKPVLREQVAEQTAQKLVSDVRAKAKVKMFNPDGSPITDPAAAPAKK